MSISYRVSYVCQTGSKCWKVIYRYRVSLCMSELQHMHDLLIQPNCNTHIQIVICIQMVIYMSKMSINVYPNAVQMLKASWFMHGPRYLLFYAKSKFSLFFSFPFPVLERRGTKFSNLHLMIIQVRTEVWAVTHHSFINAATICPATGYDLKLTKLYSKLLTNSTKLFRVQAYQELGMSSTLKLNLLLTGMASNALNVKQSFIQRILKINSYLRVVYPLNYTLYSEIWLIRGVVLVSSS